MANSEEYRQYQTLRHNRNLSVIDVSKSKGQREVQFEDGTVVTGEADDYTELVDHLVPTSRNEREVFIDVRDTTAKDVESYIRRALYFIPDSENPVDDAIHRINQGEREAPNNFDEDEVIRATLNPDDLDMENPELRRFVEDYYAMRGVFRTKAKQYHSPYRKYREERTYDIDKFDIFYEQTRTILKSTYDTDYPMNDYRRFDETCVTDVKLIARKNNEFRDMAQIVWDGFRHVDDSESEITVRFRPHEKSVEPPYEDAGEISGPIAIHQILKQYVELFELVREPLRDIAATLGAASSIDLEDTGQVLRFLEKNGQQDFTDAIEPQLRHGPSHSTVEHNEEAGIVRIFDGRGKDRKLVKEIDYEEILEQYYDLKDLVAAQLFAFMFVEQGIIARYLACQDFQFRIVENAPPDLF